MKEVVNFVFTMFGLIILGLLCLFVLALGCVHRAHGQCAGGSCAVTSVAAAVAGDDWRERADDPDRLYLFRAGVQVGGYDLAGEYYRPFDAVRGTWGDVATPPSAPPRQRPRNFGVDASKLSGIERYTVHDADGSHEVTRSHAHARVAKKLEDDSGKLRVTVIGPDPDRKRVVDELTAKMPDLPDWAIVRHYPPEHWAVAGNFVTSGKPTIYCQAPAGQVLHRQDDYKGGADELVGALRKAKGYDGKKDPDLRNVAPWLKDFDLARAGPYLAAIAGGLVVGWLVLQRKAVT